jgi:hypothetical protein
VVSQLDGLTEGQLRASVAPSGSTPLGLVRHLTLSDERYWFQVVVGGRPLDFWPDGRLRAVGPYLEIARRTGRFDPMPKGPERPTMGARRRVL